MGMLLYGLMVAHNFGFMGNKMLGYEVYRHYDPDYIGFLRHDEYHRKDRPAEMWDDGYMAWCQYDQIHRGDGPAIIWIDGYREYWIRGE